MTDMYDELRQRILTWHTARFPQAQMEHVALKVCEEAAEVGKAVNGIAGANSATGGGDLLGEAADVIIALTVLLGRWLPDADLMRAVEEKITTLETPGAHRASSK